ncbi:MAG TPA: T9SS type A sorting domain-containing protein [Saprospiraceae bacterium]|nr:T9SS type A sorting domain-containing protein [Saprospiraceae bacterium]
MKPSPNLTLLIFILAVHTLQAQWQEIPTPVGGTALSLARQNGVFFAGSWSHVFRSFDGALWSRMGDLPPSYGSSYELRAEGDRIYAHLYEAFGQPIHSQAVYYSTDQGDHWTSIPIGNDSKRIFFSGQRIFRVDNTNRLYACDDNGNCQLVWIQPESTPNNTILDIEPWNGKLLMYTVNNLWSSVDTGLTWVPVTNGLLAMSMPVEAPESQMYTAGPNILLNSGVLKLVSQDSGYTFHFIEPKNIDGRFYDMAAFQDKLYFAHLGNYYVSTDGGLSWELRDWPPVASFVTDGDTLWAGGYSGIYKSTDGEHWTFSGKNILELYSGAIEEVLAFEGGMAVQAPDGTLYVSKDGGQSFEFITNGTFDPMLVTDSGNIIVQPYRYNIANSTLDTLTIPGTADAYYYTYCYGDGQLLATRDYQNLFWRSLDDGTTWDSIPINTTDIPYQAGLIDNKLFLTFQTNGNVNMSDDLGQTWVDFRSGLSVNDAYAPYKQLFRIGDILLLQATDSTYRYTPAGWARWSKSEVHWTGDDGRYFGGVAGLEPALLAANADASVVTHLESTNPMINLTHPVSYSNNVLYTIGQSGFSPLAYPVIYTLDVEAFENSIVSGKVFLDADSDTLFDPEETPLAGNIVSGNPSGTVATSSSTGHFSFLVWQPGDTLQPQLPSPHYTAQPPYRIVNQPDTDLDFALQPKPDELDYAIHATAHNVFRPGFETNITLTCSNPGTVAEDFAVRVVLPAYMHLQTASPVQAGIVEDTITWTLPALQSLSSTGILLTVRTETFAPLNDTFDIRATIGPVDTDLDTLNNVGIIHDRVVGSYDPNDKTVFPETLTPQQLAAGETLTYRIRFQNTGTFPASIVRVLDTLPAGLDVSTLKILSASHPMHWTLKGNSILEFVFPDINLPDSISNEPGSHGFVLFSVQAQPSLPVGTSIYNQAAIYFDFNVPVFTNFAQILVKQSVGTTSASLPHSGIRLVPNPASNVVRIFFDEKTEASAFIRLFNASGQLVLQKHAGAGMDSYTIDVSALPAGTYLVKVSGRRESTALLLKTP